MTNVLSRLLAATALTCALSNQAFAQGTTQSNTTNPPPKKVVLVADTVHISAEGLLVAEGNVEALADGIRLQATQVTYDNQTGQINFEGPIRITQGEDVSIIADAAELDNELRSGLIRSARVVLAGQMQMASAEMKRLDARFNVLNQTTVSSCRVCQTGEPPLWRIRAKRVVHDQQERQIYFDHASLLIRDVPVFYFPHLRMPDPTLDRTQGFLIPTIESTSLLGYGVKVPYFIPLGDTRDLTLTPYLASETRTMEFRYRQGFEKGGIEFNGALSDDTIRPDITRGYVFANGLFDLGRDYKLTFNLRAVSDDSYLSDYDYSDLDRLNSNIKISRANRDESTEFAFHHFKSLRAEEDNDTLPSLVLQAQTERRYFPTSIGGEIRTRVEAHGHQRRSSVDGDAGRDVGRANASLQWLRNWTLRGGLRAGVTGELAFDAYRTLNDSSFSSFDSAITPSIAVDFRYPLAKIAADGATYLLEPVAQIGWTGGNNLDVANDESTRNEFDEGNLLSLSRFTSYDRRERGAQTAVGLNWSRLNTKGWQSHVSLGQIFRSEAQGDFTQTSGLSGTTSDFLIAGQLKNQTGLLLNARGLIDPNGTLDKASARVGWSNSTLWLDASYIWLNEDLQENRDQEISELALDSRYRLARHWTGLLDWRFDAVSGRASEAGLGLEYRNECVKVELSLSRRFSTSSTVQSSTSVGLSVALLGFSVNSNNKSYDRTCG
ncbi:LPS-assembly protein LptD [Shimia marina]|uniref:LPS-assembly protein LptD n=1 Tax=Shimia marina TaxID=321267 RepID=A0A0P1ESU1_9RHOB|nr:LPS assembly protein LptD [Shimia marina]CUH53609.1 Organic solvent tolerance protein [Shimia marina]SFD72978.1 LPS-assembly protein [Shimia marina]